MSEEWRAIPGWQHYEVSSQGRVKSTDRWLSGGRGLRFFEGKILTLSSDGNGYLKALLSASGRRRTIRVHRLVLNAFLPGSSDGNVARHLNGRRDDNRLDNLAWGTQADNAADKLHHGTHIQGRACYNSKLSEEDVLRIREASLFGAKWKDLGAVHGIHYTTARAAARKTWAHVPNLRSGA